MSRFLDFKKGLSGPDSREYWEFLRTIDQVVPVENVKVFYPKNLYSGEPNLKLFLFTGNDIWIAEQTSWSSVQITLHKNIQAEKLTRQIQTRNRFDGTQLSILLRSGENLEFNSKEDSPEDWIETFSEYIDEIFELIAKAP